MQPTTYGVDISARWFDVAHAEAVRRFPNTPAGIAACLGWLGEAGGPVRIGREATGSYHLPLATALYEAGHTAVMGNPLSLACYAEAVLARTKTDATDARRIARCCEAHAPAPWRPASPAQQRLHALVAARETLVQELQRLRNRRHAAGYTACATLVAELQAPVVEAIVAQSARIDRELAALAAADQEPGPALRLLTGIPGPGLVTAATLLASLPRGRLTTPRQVAAYGGRCPQARSSGSSIRGRSRTGPLGPAHLRKALYLPALVAMRATPTLRAFADRLRRAGTRPKVVGVAIMRTLRLLGWAILRSGQPSSPTHRSARPVPAVA